jgi:hypothetical protein
MTKGWALFPRHAERRPLFLRHARGIRAARVKKNLSRENEEDIDETQSEYQIFKAGGSGCPSGGRFSGNGMEPG